MSTDQTDNVTLRIIILANGETRENDLYLVTSLDTKIGELKERLQQNLSQQPLPETQRLIYSGRPLLDNDAQLRSVLRLNTNSIETAPVHVIHLVIRQDEMRASPNPASRQRAAQSNSPHPQANSPSLPSPSQHLDHDHNSNNLNAGMAANGHREFGPAHPAHLHAIVQNQMMAMQQHLAAHNQNLATMHPRPGVMNPGNMAHFPGLHNAAAQGPATNMPPPRPRSHDNTTGYQNQHHPGNTGFAGHPNNTVQSGMTTRIHETIGPNGERVRIVTNTSNPVQVNMPPGGTDPIPRSSSALGTAPPSNQASTGHQHQNQNVPPMFPPPPPALHPFPANLTLPFPTPFGLQAATQPSTQAGSPMVWLLSSPSGPQGLLFAPGHGFFSTPPSQQPRPMTTLQSVTPASVPQAAQPTPTQPTPHVQQLANEAGADQNAQLIVHPQIQYRVANAPAVQGQAHAPPQNREGADLIALFLQRGWLFIRLYMFIFVLSEPNTWRRWILLSIAVFVCLLPRQNPLTDGFNAARRHIDNLIGPPQIPQRQPPEHRQGPAAATATANLNEQAGNAGGTANQAANQRGTRQQTMLTPEEHARRLLREHRERNPSFIRGVLQPIEQALALFLASLIPGVGERHVRAREEARRTLAEEEERRRREADEATATSDTQQQNRGAAEETTTAENITDRGDESKGRGTTPAASASADMAEGRSTGIDTSDSSSSGPTLRSSASPSTDVASSS